VLAHLKARTDKGPEVRSRWNRTYKLTRMGLTPERFAQMLEAQGDACAMCREPFEDGQRICIDHDPSCCPVPPGARTRSCDECVRGLLCLTCNIAVGYVEAYTGLVMAYLAQTAPRPASPNRQAAAPRNPSRRESLLQALATTVASLLHLCHDCHPRA
jgi:hypothetical protein